MMNPLLATSLSVFLSISLLSVEYLQCYQCDKGIDIELIDTSEENSTEDNKDTEIDLEINILEGNSHLILHLGSNVKPTCHSCNLLPLYYSDIPIPPPDFS